MKTTKKRTAPKKATKKRVGAKKNTPNRNAIKSNQASIDRRFWSPEDEFFRLNIEKGLTRKDKLSEDERAVLFTPIHQLLDYRLPGNDFFFKTDSFSPTKAKQLTKKCARALTVAYKIETSGKNREEALIWNGMKDWEYKNSVCVISGIVLEWYRTEGRELEKKVVSLFSKPDW